MTPLVRPLVTQWVVYGALVTGDRETINAAQRVVMLNAGAVIRDVRAA